jgi:hypothetical protein
MVALMKTIQQGVEQLLAEFCHSCLPQFSTVASLKYKMQNGNISVKTQGEHLAALTSITKE